MPWKRRGSRSGIRFFGRRVRRTLFFVLIAALGGVLACVAVSMTTGLMDQAFNSSAMDSFLSVSPSKAAELFKSRAR